MLNARRAAIGAWVMRAFAGAVRVQYYGASVAHDIGVGLGQNIHIMAGGGKRVDEIAIEAGLEAQRGPRAAPGAPENPARTIDGVGERLTKLDIAREHRALRLRLAIAAHAAVGHDTPMLEDSERWIKRVERDAAWRQEIERAGFERKRRAPVLHQNPGARQHAARAEFPVNRLDIGHDQAARVGGAHPYGVAFA